MMAIPFKIPTPKHRFRSTAEIRWINTLFSAQQVPRSSTDHLLIATWNIANLGVQGRSNPAMRIIAHIMKRFDLIAVQEVNDAFKPFAKIVSMMGPSFDYVMSDTAGNNERLAFVYRTNKVEPANLFGELSLRPREYPKRTVKVRWTDRGVQKIDTFKNHRFTPFDRNPFIGSFRCGKLDFTIANVHLYFGKFQNSKKRKERAKYARRVLEIYALARWADRRIERATTYDKDIILMGDMNVPEMTQNQSAYDALTAFGWKPLDYNISQVGGSNLGNDRTYDQMAFAPGPVRRKIVNQGIFDFDNAIFKPLWDKLSSTMTQKRAVSKFRSHIKHHVSDHRPFWVQLKTT